jgi:aspartyl-tRNA synthetase
MESTDEKKVEQVEQTPSTQSTDATEAKKSKKEKKAPEEGGEKKDSKAEREKAKQERLAARQAKSQAAKEYVKDESDPCAHKFGDLPLNRSQSDPAKRYDKKFTQVSELEEAHAGQEVIIRGRLHSVRSKSGKLAFIIIRERFATVQGVVQANLPEVSEGMVKYTANIPKESIIEVKAKVTVPENAIHGTSQKVELQIIEIWTVNKSAPMLPFQIEDAAKRVEN